MWIVFETVEDTALVVAVPVKWVNGDKPIRGSGAVYWSEKYDQCWRRLDSLKVKSTFQAVFQLQRSSFERGFAQQTFDGVG